MPAEDSVQDNELKLRSITYSNTERQEFTIFIAMSDIEFSKFRASPQTLEPITDRIVHTIRGAEPSAEDQKAAIQTFQQRFTLGPGVKNFDL